MDPTQAKIMLVLPIGLTFLFVNFPAGLVLYWVTNNVLTISQQLITDRFLLNDKALAQQGLRRAAARTHRRPRLVYLVYLVCLVYLVEPDRLNRPDQPNEQDRLEDFFSLLPVKEASCMEDSETRFVPLPPPQARAALGSFV